MACAEERAASARRHENDERRESHASVQRARRAEDDDLFRRGAEREEVDVAAALRAELELERLPETELGTVGAVAAQDAVDALADGEDGLTVRALLAAVLDDQSDDVIEDDV